MKKAFTLIELLVVIVIIGIISAISVASFRSFMDKARQARAIAFADQVDLKVLADLTFEQRQSTAFYDFNEGSGTQINDQLGVQDPFTLGTYMSWTKDTPDGSGGISIDAPNTHRLLITQNLPQTEFMISTFFRLEAQPTGTQSTSPVSIKSNGAAGDGFAGVRILTDLSGEVYYNNDIQTYIIEFPEKIELNRWYHALLSYSADTQEFRGYVDGTHIQTIDSVLPGPLVQDARMGCVHPGAPCKMSIDRVRFSPIGYTED